MVALVLGLAYLARKTLFIFILALFFAYMLHPVVRFIDAKLTGRRLPKNAVLVLAYLVFVGALAGMGFAIGSTVSEQLTSLTTDLPKLIQEKDPLESIPLPAVLEPLRARIVVAIRSQINNLSDSAFPLIQKLAKGVLTHVEVPLFIVLVPILAFFFLKDGPHIKNTLLVWTASDDSTRAKIDEILADVHILLGSYIRALVILALATFVMYTIFFEVTGVGYPILLALVAALLEFIPVIGPLAASVIILVVAGFTGFPHLWWIVAFLLVYRMFQDYVLSPHLMAAGVELHPLLVLFGVLAGEQIGGIPGMFLSVPVIAILRVIYFRMQRTSRQRELAPELRT